MRDILVKDDKRADKKVFSAADIAFLVSRARDTLAMTQSKKERDIPSVAQTTAWLTRAGVSGPMYSLNDLRKACSYFKGKAYRKWVRVAWYAKLYIEERYKQEIPERINMELSVEEAELIRNLRIKRAA